MASDFACIMCHVVAGARKEETISEWTRERGERYARGTKTVSGLEVSGGSRGCPGERCDNRASMSAARGIMTYPGVSYYGFTTTAAGRRPRWVSLAKARTFPSSGVGCAKGGFTN